MSHRHLDELKPGRRIAETDASGLTSSFADRQAIEVVALGYETTLLDKTLMRC
jgi:hypothetical protein